MKFPNFKITEERKEMFTKPNNNFPRRSVYAPPQDTISIDLIDMVNNPDDGYKYIFNAIDVSSRKACTIPMKNKNIASLKHALMVCFSDLYKPKQIWSDQERSLLSHEIKEYLQSLGIVLYHTFGDSKASLIERYNLTMKQQMVKTDNMNNWVAFSQEFVKEYNKAQHLGINKLTPNYAYTHPDEVDEINLKKYTEYKGNEGHTFKVGDRVRILVKKGVFEKKTTTESFSNEIFLVDKVLLTNPTTYKIRDNDNNIIAGSFYAGELLKTKL
jgi:hypothetical protein